MKDPNSNATAVATGLTDGSGDNAAQSFASLLADEAGNQEERESKRPNGTEAPEAITPTGGETDESEEADDDELDAEEGDELDDADESDAGDEPEKETEAEPLHTVKVDGKEQQVPLSELINGYSRQQDYTRKTQQVAEERRAFEAEQQAIQGERQVYSQLLTQLEQQLTSSAEPDWEKLYNEDPIEYVRAQQLHQERTRRLEATRQEQARLSAEQQQSQQAQVRALVAEEAQKLTSAIPEWGDKQVAKRERDQLMRFGTQNLGFTETELDQITDHRAVVALRKAMLYDQLQQGREQLKAKRKPAASQTVAPGSSPRRAVTQPEATKARRRLAKSGTVRDAAAVFESLLD